MVVFLDTSPKILNSAPLSDSDSEVEHRKNTVPLIKDAEWLNAGRPGMKLENPNENILVSKLGGGSTNPLRDIDMLTIMLARLGAELHAAHWFSS